MLPTYRTVGGMSPGQYQSAISLGGGLYNHEDTAPSISAITTGAGNMPPALPSAFGGGPVTNPGTQGPATGGTVPTTTPTPTPTPAPTATPTTPGQSPYDAFLNFKDSAGYQFALDEAMNALNNKYAASGQLESGAAAKGIVDYAQNMALQNYFFPYMNLLQGQQGMGVGAAGSIAGVGSNFGSTAAGINGQIGGAIQNGANALSNGAIINGSANAGMWGNIGSALGNLGSSVVGSSSPAVNYGSIPGYPSYLS